jgi:hypothetical protein
VMRLLSIDMQKSPMREIVLVVRTGIDHQMPRV